MCNPDFQLHPLLPTDAGQNAVGSGTITASVRALMPSHPACAEALALAKSSLPPSILYHSFRVFLYAQAFLRLDHQEDDFSEGSTDRDHGPAAAITTTAGVMEGRIPDHVLFVGCILHDVGTASQYDAIPERFEVVGADVAARLLRNHTNTAAGQSDSTVNVHEIHVRDIWMALALHTSPGIAERMGGTVRAVRLAVRADFGSYPPPSVESIIPDTNVVRWGLPRLEIEKELGDAVVRQAVRDRQKAPKASWPGDLVRARDEDPDWDGVNKGF
ncbi:hypothetical protein B0H66DRAFT_507612 [Apodospora peruviana]|uniref:HD domain-containing protein n=1 Tax=Apodospora peruviana TaxID=516989 RepID=A0AAE0ME58_9PEZI|nr:hypothetical protein B0H66DRAFT_507612 [Apodospora peruviana]